MRRNNRSFTKAIAGKTLPPVKTGVTISAEAHRLLSAACLAEGQNQSQLVELLILTHLSGYYVARRSPGETGDNQAVA